MLMHDPLNFTYLKQLDDYFMFEEDSVTKRTSLSCDIVLKVSRLNDKDVKKKQEFNEWCTKRTKESPETTFQYLLDQFHYCFIDQPWSTPNYMSRYIYTFPIQKEGILLDENGNIEYKKTKKFDSKTGRTEVDNQGNVIYETDYDRPIYTNQELHSHNGQIYWSYLIGYSNNWTNDKTLDLLRSVMRSKYEFENVQLDLYNETGKYYHVQDIIQNSQHTWELRRKPLYFFLHDSWFVTNEDEQMKIKIKMKQKEKEEAKKNNENEDAEEEEEEQEENDTMLFSTIPPRVQRGYDWTQQTLYQGRGLKNKTNNDALMQEETWCWKRTKGCIPLCCKDTKNGKMLNFCGLMKRGFRSILWRCCEKDEYDLFELDWENDAFFDHQEKDE